MPKKKKAVHKGVYNTHVVRKGKRYRILRDADGQFAGWNTKAKAKTAKA